MQPNAKTGLVPVRLKKNVGNINAGEIAGFSPEFAEKLIKMDAASPYEEKKGAAAKEPPKDPPAT